MPQDVTASMFLRWIGLHGRLAAQLASADSGGIASKWRHEASRSAARPLLLYSQVAWDDVWQRPQEMAVGLAKHRPVLFCSPVQLHQVAGPLQGRWQSSRVMADGKLLVASPLILTGEYRAAPVRALNRRILVAYLRKVLGGLEVDFLTNSPFADYLVPALRPKHVGYDLIDDFCAFDWAPSDGREREQRLLKAHDFAFAGTNSLKEKFAPQIAGLEFLPSGVDFDKMTRPAKEPAELIDLPRPRLLYVGTLNDRLSGELIDATARRFPQASIVLVGPRRAAFRAPRFPDNVHEIGLKPHGDLPAFYQHCDLGIMPFADNEAARAINPVKTLEFLACGLPVISTPVPDVERFYVPPVVIAQPSDWPDRIAEMLAEDSDEARTARRDFARGRSWEALVKKVEAKLRALDGGGAAP